MGQGYEYKCPDCGYEFRAMLGIGMGYPSVYMETMEEALKGELGTQAKDFIRKYPTGAIDPANVIVRCEECGKLETVRALDMYVPKEGCEATEDGEYIVDFSDYDLIQRYDHRCSACNGTMKRVSVKEMNNVACPVCSSKLVRGLAIMWD